MRISTLKLIGASLIAALLAACGGNNSLSSSMPVTAARQATPNLKYGVLYSFGYDASHDGEYPYAGLLDVNDTLYGTTYSGGIKGGGTVFKVTPSGAETVLKSFKSGPNGYNPDASLVDYNGTLYGTTWSGGKTRKPTQDGFGTVFSITTSGRETVLHSFQGPKRDGEGPYAGLLNVNGVFYGTTVYGGATDGGAVYKITPSGTKTVLHSFNSSTDGINPYASLIDVKGTLYGTTYYGGSPLGGSNGTVFSITQSGDEKELYAFSGSGDGRFPISGLVNVNGTLYGTTTSGGANGDGTVFSITTSGKEAVIYSFKGGSGDGETPDAGLVDVKGTLYGTTTAGGAGGDGTIFSITASGTETVLHSFGTGSGDGAWPNAGLINVKGRLYGTTVYGGATNAGTVFWLSP